MAHACNERSQALRDWKPLSDRSIDKVHQVVVLVNGKPAESEVIELEEEQVRTSLRFWRCR